MFPVSNNLKRGTSKVEDEEVEVDDDVEEEEVAEEVEPVEEVDVVSVEVEESDDVGNISEDSRILLMTIVENTT